MQKSQHTSTAGSSAVSNHSLTTLGLICEKINKSRKIAASGGSQWTFLPFIFCLSMSFKIKLNDESIWGCSTCTWILGFWLSRRISSLFSILVFIFLLRIMSNTEINMSEGKLKPKWMTDTWFCFCQTGTYHCHFYSCQWHWWYCLQNKVIFNAHQAGRLKPFQSLDFLGGRYF